MEFKKYLNKQYILSFFKYLVFAIILIILISKILDLFEEKILKNFIENSFLLFIIKLLAELILFWKSYWSIVNFLESYLNKDSLKKQLLGSKETNYFRNWYEIDPIGFDEMIKRYKLELIEICKLPEELRIQKSGNFLGKELVPYIERTSDEIIYQNAKLDAELELLLFNQSPELLLKKIYPEYFGILESNMVNSRANEILENSSNLFFKSINNEKVNFDLHLGIECLEKHKNEFLNSNREFKNVLEKVSIELNEQEKLILAKGYLDLTNYYLNFPYEDVVQIFRTIYMTEKGIK